MDYFTPWVIGIVVAMADWWHLIPLTALLPGIMATVPEEATHLRILDKRPRWMKH